MWCCGHQNGAYGQGSQEEASSVTNFLKSGCNAYYFKEYPQAAAFFASCELGTGEDDTFTPQEITAKGSYWFSTVVLGCNWDVPSSCSIPTDVTGDMDDFCSIDTTDWEDFVVRNNKNTAITYNSVLLTYGAKRNTRPSFYRGRAAAPDDVDEWPTCAGNGHCSVTDRADDDDWASSYAEYFVKTEAVEITPDTDLQSNLDFKVDVTLTTSTPGAHIHYFYWENFQRENVLQVFPTTTMEQGVQNLFTGEKYCTGSVTGILNRAGGGRMSDVEDEADCMNRCVRASEMDPASYRFCQYGVDSSDNKRCEATSTCDATTLATDTGYTYTIKRVIVDVVRRSQPAADGQMDGRQTNRDDRVAGTAKGYDITSIRADIAEEKEELSLDDVSTGYSSTTALGESFSFDGFPDSGWYRDADGYQYFDSSQLAKYRADGTPNLDGGTWAHCDMELDTVTPAPGTTVVQLSGTKSDSAPSSCKLRLERGGRLFAFATRASDYVTADADTGGVQTPSDATWSDFTLQIPGLTWEMYAASCGRDGRTDYCSKPYNSNNAIITPVQNTRKPNM